MVSTIWRMRSSEAMQEQDACHSPNSRPALAGNQKLSEGLQEQVMQIGE